MTILIIVIVILVVLNNMPNKLTHGGQLEYIKLTIENMNSREFEIFCGKLFELQEFKVKVTKATGDGGKDLIMYKGKQKYYVECKHFKAGSKVSRCIANKLFGVMCADRVKNGIIITTGEFTKECYAWCRKNNIKTVNLNGILKIVDTIGTERVLKVI